MKNQILADDITPHAIARRLVAERKRLGLHQDDVRQVLGVAYATMSRYENGHRMPEADKIGMLARLGFDVDYIITGQRDDLCLSDLSSDERALLDLYRLSQDKQGLSKLAKAWVATQI